MSDSRRLVNVNGSSKLGYFHMWEQYSRPVTPASLIGDVPGSRTYAQVYAIVEFANGVRRLDPTEITFCKRSIVPWCDHCLTDRELIEIRRNNRRIEKEKDNE